jgi:hypothetical protein
MATMRVLGSAWLCLRFTFSFFGPLRLVARSNRCSRPRSVGLPGWSPVDDARARKVFEDAGCETCVR